MQQSTVSLRRNFSAVMIGNLIYVAAQFGMLVAVVRLTDMEEVGRYGLALAITAPIFLFAGMRLRQVQATDAAGRNAPGEYFGLRIVTSTIALGASTIAAFAASLPTSTTLTVIAVATFKALEAQVDILYGTLIRHEQMTGVGRSQAVRGVLGLIFFVGTLWTTGHVWAAVGALAVYTVAPVYTNGRRVRRLSISTRPSFNTQPLWRLALLALPLAVAVSATSLIVNVPRYLLQSYTGAAALGVFTALAYILVATGTVVNAASEAASPRLANQFAAGDAEGFKRLMRKLILFSVALGGVGVIGAATLGRPALWLVFGPDYSREWGVLVLLMMAVTVQYAGAFMAVAASAARMFAAQAPINLAGLASTIVVGLVLIPRWGLEGAAVTMIVTQVVQLALFSLLYARGVRPALAPQGPEAGP